MFKISLFFCIIVAVTQSYANTVPASTSRLPQARTLGGLLGSLGNSLGGGLGGPLGGQLSSPLGGPLGGSYGQYRAGCPLCDSSVYSYCSDKLYHDACCCNDPYAIRLPHHCQYADCSFLHSNSCQEHELITNCCCDSYVK